MDYVTGTFVDGLKKGQVFELNGKQYTVTAVTESRVRIKSSDGKTIEGRKYGNEFVGKERYNQFVRDVEGQISVDLINEDNPFHRASDVFRLTQQFIGALPAENRTISGPKFSKLKIDGRRKWPLGLVVPAQYDEGHAQYCYSCSHPIQHGRLDPIYDSEPNQGGRDVDATVSSINAATGGWVQRQQPNEEGQTCGRWKQKPHRSTLT